jgi:hypothetical protein
MLTIHLFVNRNDENMFAIADLISIAVIIGSFAVVAFNIRSEMKKSI